MAGKRGRLSANGVVRNRLVLRSVVAFGLSASGLAAASAPASAASPLCGGAGSGSSTIKTTDGDTHTYYYRIPTTPPPAGGRPVLFWMHGDGGGTGAPPFESQFYPYTDHDGAIVITPNGGGGAWAHTAGDVAGHSEDSQFISLILDQLDGCGAVNHAKYFMGGASAGAYMPYYLLQRTSTRSRIAGAAVNAGLLYCQAGDDQCVDDPDNPAFATFHSSPVPIIHIHGTDDPVVEPPPTATFHNPIDWSVDWKVFWPMNFWAREHGCFDGGNPPADNGVLKETYTANGHTARVYDLTGHGAACAKYQLILVDNGGHVIAGQEGRIWNFLMGPSIAVYRFWSSRFNNAHFYTAGQAEADGVRESDPNWAFEGIAFRAYPSSSGSCTVSGTSPVFRFFSSTFGSHFYTSISVEAEHIKATDPNWSYEGVAYCAFSSTATDRIALYRFWSPVFDKHFYTASATEADHLKTSDPNWHYEGAAYYVLP